jgi:pimeloyl-ACP methyl ester carboxylesterase
MPTLKINDISMYYETHGQGEPLVLIAGFSVDMTTWLPALEFLKTRYQVILFDNRGAGQTDVPEGPYTISQLADDVAALCAGLCIKQAHFVGNSMGGFILQELARRHPELIKTAIISNSTMSIDCVFHLYVAAQFQLLKANAPLAALLQASCCWAFSYRFLALPGMLDQLIQIGLNNPHPFTLTGYSGQYAALDQFDSRSWASTLRVPVLVLAGDQDLIFNERIVKQLADAIPAAKYHCFTECGHLPMMEYPEEFADIVSEFVSSQHFG